MRFSSAIKGAALSAAVLSGGTNAGLAQRPAFRASWVQVQPVRSFGSNVYGKFGGEIQSMLPAGHIYVTPGESVVNAAHETTHGINSRIRQMYSGKVNALFVGSGRAMVLREPRVRLSDVLRFVPSELRGSGAGLYLQQQQSYWQNEPLYVLDEWTSYVNGSLVGLDVGRPEALSIERAVEFGGYATALLCAVEQLDSAYADKDALAEFVSWQLARVEWLSERAKKAGVWGANHEALSTRFLSRFVRDE